MNKVVYTWQDVEEYVKGVCEKYKSIDLSGVCGIPRGGLILAVMISHRMKLPLLSAPARNCLIVDDICDSGESLLHYKRNSSSLNKPLYHITTMVYKENPLVQPEYYSKKKNDDWIVFPWEDNECIE